MVYGAGSCSGAGVAMDGIGAPNSWARLGFSKVSHLTSLLILSFLGS